MIRMLFNQMQRAHVAAVFILMARATISMVCWSILSYQWLMLLDPGIKQEILSGDYMLASISLWRIVLMFTQGSVQELGLRWAAVLCSCVNGIWLGFAATYLLTPAPRTTIKKIARLVGLYTLVDILMWTSSLAITLLLFIAHIYPERWIYHMLYTFYTPCQSGMCPTTDVLGSDLYNMLLLSVSLIPVIIVFMILYLPLWYIYDMIIDQVPVRHWWRQGARVLRATWLKLLGVGAHILFLLISGQLLLDLLAWGIGYFIPCARLYIALAAQACFFVWMYSLMAYGITRRIELYKRYTPKQ